MHSFSLQLFGVLACALGQTGADDTRASNLRGSVYDSSEKAYCCFSCSGGGCSAEYSAVAKEVAPEAGTCIKGGTITPMGNQGSNCGDPAEAYCCFWCSGGGCSAEYLADTKEVNPEAGTCIKGGTITSMGHQGSKCSDLVQDAVQLYSEPQCVPSNGECGGPGRHTETCCGNAKCTSFMGGEVMKCVEELPKCVPANEECGGPGRRTETCCGNAKCTSFMGNGVMKCVEEHQLVEEGSASQGGVANLLGSAHVEDSTDLSSGLQCVPSNGECGGPGRHTETCCGNAKCTSFMGNGVMKCVEQPKCVPANGECGGPGRHTDTCCGNAKCTSFMGTGVMKCIEEQSQCVPRKGECGGPGRHTETCCGNAKCTRFMGGGIMKCM